jgi:hypothetical protein
MAGVPQEQASGGADLAEMDADFRRLAGVAADVCEAPAAEAPAEDVIMEDAADPAPAHDVPLQDVTMEDAVEEDDKGAGPPPEAHCRPRDELKPEDPDEDGDEGATPMDVDDDAACAGAGAGPAEPATDLDACIDLTDDDRRVKIEPATDLDDCIDLTDDDRRAKIEPATDLDDCIDLTDDDRRAKVEPGTDLDDCIDLTDDDRRAEAVSVAGSDVAEIDSDEDDARAGLDEYPREFAARPTPTALPKFVVRPTADGAGCTVHAKGQRRAAGVAFEDALVGIDFTELVGKVFGWRETAPRSWRLELQRVGDDVAAIGRMTLVVAYLRVSSIGQLHGHGLATQLQAIVAACSNKYGAMGVKWAFLKVQKKQKKKGTEKKQ